MAEESSEMEIWGEGEFIFKMRSMKITFPFITISSSMTEIHFKI